MSETERTEQSPGPWYVLHETQGIIGGSYETKSDAMWLIFQTTTGARRIGAGCYEFAAFDAYRCTVYYIVTEEGARRHGRGELFDTSASTSATMEPMSTPTLSTLAQEAYDCFEYREHAEAAGGGRHAHVKEGSPDWVTDLVREAHGDMMPDNWRYDAIVNALERISDSDAETERDLEDLDHEYCDAQVDVYTSARHEWLASSLSRSGYCDDAVSEGLVGPDTDLTDRIGIGQYMEAREVWGSVVRSLVDHQEAVDEDEDEEPYVVIDTKPDSGPVKVGEQFPVLGRFATESAAARFIATQPDHETGRYGLDGPADD
jgi:hypothetical protein